MRIRVWFIPCTIVLCFMMSFQQTAKGQLKHSTVYVGDKLVLDTTVHTYLADTLINVFAGEWEWRSGDSSIIFRMEKTTREFGSARRELKMDQMNIAYTFKVADRLLSSTPDSMSLVGGSMGDHGVLHIIITDFQKKLNYPIEFIALAEGQILLRNSRKSPTRIMIPDGFVFELPLNIKFHRKNPCGIN